MGIGAASCLVDSTLCPITSSSCIGSVKWMIRFSNGFVRHIPERQLPDGGWNIYYGVRAK